MINRHKPPQLSEGERTEFILNAYSSFKHGVEHFTKYAEGGGDIKFCILHVFHTVELLVKSYLGSVNLNLLREKMDDEGEFNLDRSKSAGIALLLKRMDKFSEVSFGDALASDINTLRERRNEIEHRQFNLEGDREIIVLLCRVINGLLVFAKYHLGLDLAPELITNTKASFDTARLTIDPIFSEAMNQIGIFTKIGYRLVTCPFCLNKTVPFREASTCRCFYCKKEVDIFSCEKCNKFYPISSPVKRGYPGECDGCQADEWEKGKAEHDKNVEEYDKNNPYPWDNLKKERYAD